MSQDHPMHDAREDRETAAQESAEIAPCYERSVEEVAANVYVRDLQRLAEDREFVMVPISETALTLLQRAATRDRLAAIVLDALSTEFRHARDEQKD